jgi:hypothetical protein
MREPKTENPLFRRGPSYRPSRSYSELSSVVLRVPKNMLRVPKNMLRVPKNMLRASQAERRIAQPLLKFA